MKDGLTAEYAESSAVRVNRQGMSDAVKELYGDDDIWEPRFHEATNGDPVRNPMWRGALVLLLEPCGMVGPICFILCAALEDYWDIMDGTEVKEGELRVIGSINLSLIKAKSEPLPNRAARRGGLIH